MYTQIDYRTRRNIGENNIWRNTTQNHFGGLNVGDFIKLYLYARIIFNVRVSALSMETHVFDSCIRGHHVSKDFWTALSLAE